MLARLLPPDWAIGLRKRSSLVFRIWTAVSGTFVLAGCVTTGAKPEPFPRPAASLPAYSRPTSSAPATQAIVNTALGLRGIPYRNGGNDPTGFDCSGFVWYVFARNGISVPRTVSDLFAQTTPVAADEIGSGDLVFFDTGQGRVTHVGIALGGNEFVHAPSSTGEVRTERMNGPYWASRFVAARRVP